MIKLQKIAEAGQTFRIRAAGAGVDLRTQTTDNTVSLILPQIT